MTVLSSMAGGGQAGEVVLWDAPSGASSLLLSGDLVIIKFHALPFPVT